MPGDATLLRQFVDAASDVAFRELVLRRFDFVYAAALRQVGGDAHLAREVAQNVFIDLARKARSLATRPNIAGWLYTSTRFAAAKALRSRVRRMNHETEAHETDTIVRPHTNDAAAWSGLRPVLDAALHELTERDREAILLRYFEGLSHSEIGAALGVGENTARMRVDRALERLRGRLERCGITSTAAALGVALAAQPIVAAPAGLAATVARASLAAAATASAPVLGAVWSALTFMNSTKVIVGTAGAVAALAVGVYLGTQRPGRNGETVATSSARAAGSSDAALREENRRLRDDVARLSAERPTLPATRGGATPGTEERRSALDRLRVLTDLQQRKLAKSEMDFVTGGKLTPAFGELFATTPAEQETLQRELDVARDTLAELERANAIVSPQPNGDVIVAVKAFPETGGQLYDALLKTFAETLGPERYNAFLALGVEQVEKSLGRFGAPQRTITFSRTVAADNSVSYAMHESLKLPRENGNYTSDFKSFADLAQQAGPIVKLLPPTFAPRP